MKTMDILDPFRRNGKLKQQMDQLMETAWEEEYGRKWGKILPALTILDAGYPHMLQEMADPPAVFFYSGNPELLHKNSLAIVGSRKATSYSQEVLEKLLPELLARGVVIVSGLAAGVDSMAHRYTIDQGGDTIGIIGTGLKNYYPAANALLQQEMSRNHLVISEFPFQAPPRREHFPQRNRIIAGLTQATLVIQAQQHSGSLITANYALQYNREIFAVPGSILEAHSQGTNQLIQAGAKPVLSPFDILEEMQYIWNF